MKTVRRKVVDWYRNRATDSLLNVKLECGHWDLAYLRKRPGAIVPSCPEKVKCMTCTREANEVQNES